MRDLPAPGDADHGEEALAKAETGDPG